MADLAESSFRFVVLADTHLRPENAAGTTPWRTNRLANSRSRYVAEQIERLGPVFVIHLGDMVHPLPTMPEYAEAARVFRQIYGTLTAPLYTIPGNHDIGDKPGQGMPAPNVCDASVSTYRQHFGAGYASFEHQDCRFLLLNAPVLNSGLAEERAQREWLETELAVHAGRRFFLFMHYPLLLDEPSEPAHYDNVDPPARGWLLSLIERHRTEAVFAGHIHNFSYNRLGSANFYVVPTATFLRHDYSELFRIGPAAEYGRNDTDKLGFFEVTVRPRGHTLRFIRTGGRTLEDEPIASRSARAEPSGATGSLSARADPAADTGGQAASSTPADKPPVVPRSGEYRLPVGVDLSHPWAEVVGLPCNYLVDLFVRKRIVNDYPLLALLTLGIRRLRVPTADLLDPRVRDRLGLLTRHGLEASVLSLGVPDERVADALREYAGLVRAVEVVLSPHAFAAAREPIRALKEATELPILISLLETSAAAGKALSKGNYWIAHGFPSDEASLETQSAYLGRELPGVDGFSFRVRPGQNLWDAIEGIAAWSARHGCLASTTVQIAADSPAEAVEDDAGSANRVAEAAAAALCFPDVAVVLDTFSDNDRGYYVRHGVVDRRYNARLAGRVLSHLAGIVGQAGEEFRPESRVQLGHGVRLRWRAGTHRFILLLPKPGSPSTSLSDWDLPGNFLRAACYELAIGGEPSAANPNARLAATPYLLVTTT